LALGAMRYIFEPESVPDRYMQPDGTWISEFVLGYELDAGTVVFMRVLLVPNLGSNNENRSYDLQFGIVEKLRSAPTTQTCMDFSIIATRRFVPRQGRELVSMILLRCVKDTVELAKPPAITMETYHSFLPDDALKKYDRITNMLTDLLYDLADRFRADDGVDYWLYRRRLQTSGTIGSP
jgi:hypothetical protein